MRTHSDPTWWKNDYDSSWERTKAALKRDWEQTKHDFGGDEPDTDQGVTDTVKQAAGKQPIPPPGVLTQEDYDSAHRFGYGARKYYGSKYQKWDASLEKQLREDWRDYNDDDRDWERRRDAIRYGYEYDKK